MNAKGILMVALLVVFGGSPILSQIEAGKAVPIANAEVAELDVALIEAGMPIQIIISDVPAEQKGKIDAIYPVSKWGTVNLPFIGKIQAAGKTPEKLAGDIRNAYIDGQIFAAPDIRVVADPGGILVVKVIHVGGQVRKPGPVDFVEGMTIGDAVKAAGGATEFGSLLRVKLFRDGKMTAYDLTKGENMAIPLKRNDTIEIPQKNWFGK